MKSLKRVLIMAGGTGGHIFPGLAVANRLREKGIEVHWLGTRQGLESRLVTDANFPLHFIAVGGLRGKGFLPLVAAPIKIARAIKQAARIIKKINPDVVVGMGGFVSGPGGIASWLLGKPLIIHEQNAKAGLTNKWLARFAKKVLQSFPHAFPSQAKVVMVGNPVRSEIEELPPPEIRLARQAAPFRLLILGGSLGAQALNQIVPRALAQIAPHERPDVIHQTGNKHFATVKNSYDSLDVSVKLEPFITDMAQAYAWADMVLCRAGALTIAELCAVGIGAILVPFPQAVDDHQTANARFMVNNAAAICIQQIELTESRLAAIVKEFGKSPEKRLAMAQAAYQLRQKDVARKIVEICEEVCR